MEGEAVVPSGKCSFPRGRQSSICQPIREDGQSGEIAHVSSSRDYLVHLLFHATVFRIVRWQCSVTPVMVSDLGLRCELVTCYRVLLERGFTISASTGLCTRIPSSYRIQTTALGYALFGICDTSSLSR